jgi:prenyltransferase beta subunit
MRLVRAFAVLLAIVMLGAACGPARPTAAPTSGSTFERAVAYVRAAQQADGGWAMLRTQPSDVEDTIWAVWALLDGGEAKTSERVQKGLKFVLGKQDATGHWNNNTSHTAFAILLLHKLGKDKEEAASKALAWLQSVQNPDGSWPKSPKVEGLTTYTGVSMVALNTVSPGNPALAKAVDWLHQWQRPEGYWIMTPSQGDDPWHTMATTWAIQGLVAAGAKPEADQSLQRGLDWLRQIQAADGGFPLYIAPTGQAQPSSDPELAAYALLAFAAVGQQNTAAIERAIAYLEESQASDGGFLSILPNLKMPEPSVNLQTTAFVVIALKAVRP